jgi:hypothetical protein
MEICFDSSSINIALRTQDTWAKFITIASTSKQLLIISPVVLTELLSGNNLKRVSKRAFQLADMWGKAGEHFAVSGTIRHIISEELERPLWRTPLLPHLLRIKLREWLSDPESPFFNPSQRNEMTQELVESKEIAIRMDKRMSVMPEKRRLFANKQQREEMHAHIMSYSGPTDDFGWALEGLFNDPTILSIRHIDIADIRKNERYLASNLFLSQIQLQMFGAALAEYFQDPIMLAFRSHEGNWLDASIMASAAYADVFVVDDPNANARAKFLVEHQIAKFKVKTLMEWVSNPK